jgi:short-subunit dehydrogenase
MTSDTSKASNKGTAVVTGASAGIGARYAQHLAERGYDIIMVARNRERMDSLARRLAAETGRKFDIVEADLSVTADVRRVAEILRTNASITLLVNNAGVGAVAPLLDSDADAMQSMIDINVTALTRLTMAIAPAFVARGGGTIINIASIVAIIPEMLNGVYGATKAFVLAYSQSLRHELADKGVRIQAVLPGAISTEFWEIAGTSVDALPSGITMTADNLVKSALAGLDQGEFVTIPSLPDAADWKKYDDARNAMAPNLSRETPAERYGVAALAS